MLLKDKPKIKHKHHIIPRHAGGTDDPSNLIELSIEEHAQAHLNLYEQHGDQRDLLAHRMLLGQVTNAEANALLRKLPKTQQHKDKISVAVSGAKNGMYGKKTSQKQKDAVSKATKGIPKPKLSALYKERCANGTHHLPDTRGAKNGMARAVTWDGVDYPTLTEASKMTGIHRATLAFRINKQISKQ